MVVQPRGHQYLYYVYTKHNENIIERKKQGEIHVLLDPLKICSCGIKPILYHFKIRNSLPFWLVER